MLHNQELYSLHRSLSIDRMIDTRKLRCTRRYNVARMEEGSSAFKILIGTPAGQKRLGRPRRDRKTILEWILKK